MFENVHAALRRIQKDVSQVLDPAAILGICKEIGYRFRSRVLDPVTTVHLFVVQILNGNFAVGRLMDFTDVVFSEAAYCKARCRLPLQVLVTLLQRVASAWRNTMSDYGRWRGHRTFHVDGSSFSMLDTPELQKEFGQPGNQKPGCGFPVAHILTLFHAGTGFLLKVLAAPLRTHDLEQVVQVHPEMEAGDVLIGDRAFCSFAQFALLLDRGLHGVFRAHQKLIINFRSGRAHNVRGSNRNRKKGRPSSRWLKRLGVRDQLVEHFKPKKRPTWMTKAEYAALPNSIMLRELRYEVVQPGRRTKRVTLITTLLDPVQYPAQAVADLYGQRWQIETNLRHLKQTMNMDILRCETVAGVLKELTMFALVYNLVRTVMCVAAERQQVAVDRISFADAFG
jgi:Transposase DDE domain